MTGKAPERLVSGSDDFTMFLWEADVRKDPSNNADVSKDAAASKLTIMSKHPKTRMTGHQQVGGVFFAVFSVNYKLIFLAGQVGALCVLRRKNLCTVSLCMVGGFRRFGIYLYFDGG